MFLFLFRQSVLLSSTKINGSIGVCLKLKCYTLLPMGAKTKASKMEKRIKARQVEFLAANDLTNWTKNEEDYIYARGLIQKL